MSIKLSFVAGVRISNMCFLLMDLKSLVTRTQTDRQTVDFLCGLVVKICASTVGAGSIPGQRTKILRSAAKNKTIKVD